MTDWPLVLLLIALSAWGLAATLYGVLSYRRAQRIARLAQDNAAKHDHLMNLLAAAALAKGGTLRIPCRRPNWEAPGVNLERKGNVWFVTVREGP